MKERLLDLLACPTCGGDILLAYAPQYDGSEIMEAVLARKKRAAGDLLMRHLARTGEAVAGVLESSPSAVVGQGKAGTEVLQQESSLADPRFVRGRRKKTR